MQGILDYLFGAASFMPHGYCLLWRPDLVALHAISDGLIAAAYFSIPVALTVFLHRRRDLAYGWMFGLFALFILACGTTHLLSLVTLFEPIYGFQGLIKALTAGVSVATAIALWPVIPKALALPSTAELKAINARLARGIEERLIAQQQLQFAYQKIEERVIARTRELAEVNVRLMAEIAERERAEAQQELLLAELRHRVRNTLTIVKSIATQTRRHSDSLETFNRSFNARVQALADTHTLLFESNWTRSHLDDLIRQHLRPYGGSERALIAGPPLAVRPRSALSLSLVLHELAANAARHGALSTDDGRLEISWSIDAGPPRRLELVWQEHGGPAVEAPTRRGFGAEVIDFTVALEFEGEVGFEYPPQGIRAHLVLPLNDDML